MCVYSDYSHLYFCDKCLTEKLNGGGDYFDSVFKSQNNLLHYGSKALAGRGFHSWQQGLVVWLFAFWKIRRQSAEGSAQNQKSISLSPVICFCYGGHNP